ncbi:MAG: universal stress protein [Syntrophobacteraceae bacterium]
MLMNILFPVFRYTDVSTIIAPFVRNMSRVYKARLHLLCVEAPIDQFISLRVKEAGEWVHNFIGQYLADCTVASVDVVTGDPADEILKYIGEKSIDLVIMGTHGAKGLNAIIFGSVASQVIANAPMPVMVINPHRITEAFHKRSAEIFEALLSCPDEPCADPPVETS